MCVILNFEPGAMIPKDAFLNAIYNNWHSWGLIVKTSDGKMNMWKECPESGENDPEMLWKLIESNKAHRRIFHARFATKGSVNKENAQPFEVFNDGKRQVFFMHNGTLTKFGSTNYTNWQNRDRDLEHTDSDSAQFASKILKKALTNWYGPNGVADYNDPNFKDVIIEPSWTEASKGILISNDGNELMFGPSNSGWKEYKIPDWKEGEPKVFISNDDYFDRLTRGPEKERREKAEREAKAANGNQCEIPFRNQNTAGTGAIIDNLVAFRKGLLARDPRVVEHLSKIWDDMDIWDIDGVADLGYVTGDEWEAFCQKEEPEIIAYLLSMLSDHLWNNREEREKLNKKINRYGKKINELLGYEFKEDINVQNSAAA